MSMRVKYVFPNLGSLIELIGTKPILNGYKEKIDEAKKENRTEDEKQLIYEVMTTWTKEVIKLYGINVIVHNPENLPTGGSHVYIGNHQSYFDILSLLTVIKEPTTVIAKKEFEAVPLLGAWIKRVRGVSIERGNKRQSLKAIGEGVELLKNGYSMVIFPEGTRSRSNSIGTFHRGSFKLATKGKFPIVPITFKNAAKVYEEVGHIEKGVDLEIFVHPMVDTKDLTREEIVDLPNKIEEIIKSKL